MSAFLDTNILIYAQQADRKGERARDLLRAGGTVSVQVLNEFAAVASRKLGRSWAAIGEAVDDVLACVGDPLPLTLDMHGRARQLAQDHGLSFYDALIVAAATAAGCATLYSEDLQNHREFGGLRIVNPFMPAAG